jgi:succinate dehydrogenase / fumarate reductase cytochrome b subunit
MQATTEKGGRPQRPLSPHLQIYSPLINMVTSILHRITGAALYFGSFLLVIWLLAAATGPDAYNYVAGLFATWPAKIVLLVYTWALAQHLLTGVRHLIWDLGAGYDLKTVDVSSWATLAGSFTLTALIWIGVAMNGGL